MANKPELNMNEISHMTKNDVLNLVAALLFYIVELEKNLLYIRTTVKKF
jgi:hypothetical protein